jgi:hypothetical protein
MDTAFASTTSSKQVFNLAAKRRYNAQPGDHNTSFHANLSFSQHLGPLIKSACAGSLRNPTPSNRPQA